MQEVRNSSKATLTREGLGTLPVTLLSRLLLLTPVGPSPSSEDVTPFTGVSFEPLLIVVPAGPLPLMPLANERFRPVAFLALSDPPAAPAAVAAASVAVRPRPPRGRFMAGGFPMPSSRFGVA